MTRSTIAQALSALVLAASAVGHPAVAQPADPPVGVTVSYADLDISRPAGATALLSRLQAAAVQACGGAPDVRLLAQGAAFDRCRREAVTRAIAQVDSPTLNEMASRRPSGAQMANR